MSRLTSEIVTDELLIKDSTRQIENPAALTIGFYLPTDAFRAIPEHTAVMFDGGLNPNGLVAVTGQAGDPIALKYAQWFAASPKLIQAIYFLGGGIAYLQKYNRLCFCDCGEGRNAEHADACQMTWDAFQLAIPSWRKQLLNVAYLNTLPCDYCDKQVPVWDAKPSQFGFAYLCDDCHTNFTDWFDEMLVNDQFEAWLIDNERN
ncbi:MAG: hypothetical protein IAF02_14665 [Anaerolineae bacterium]|nr:hypothetical protein [Anaerolineae bacterium]